MKKTIGSLLDRRFFGHTVYIKNEATEEFGTGTLIQNQNNWYVLTAAHVTKNANDSQIFMNIGIEGSRLERVKILVQDEYLDYCVLGLDAFEAQIKLGEKNQPFVFNAQMGLDQTPNFNRIVIVGYPNALVENHGLTKDRRKIDHPERFFFSIWETMPMDPEYWPDRLKKEVNPEHFLLLDYNPSRTAPFVDKNGNATEVFDLHGMSGGPVWLIDKDTTNDPSPKYGFYGVYTSFFRFEKMWQFTRVDAILKNAKDIYGLELLGKV